MRTWILGLAVAALPPTSARADSANGGEGVFKARCAACHSVGVAGTAGSGYGPRLDGVVGSKAASRTDFGYSKALRDSGLIWTKATLESFLAAPSKLVPGTRMPVATPDPADRSALISYLSSLPRSKESTAAPAPWSAAATSGANAGDYREDAPGTSHHVALADLPAPFATKSSRNSPRVSDLPAGAHPVAPPGFRVDLFASGLDNPRLLRAAPNGDVFVAESNAGKIVVLRAKDGATAAEKTSTYASGLDQPFGIAFYPPGPSPRFVYVANTDSVVRFPYTEGDLVARGAPEKIVRTLTRSRGGGHWTRDLAFSPDGKRMFVSVGSASNVAEGMDKWPAAKITDWEARYGVGAAWGDEQGRADVRVFDPQGKGDQVFAAGLRNCVGLAFSPTGDLWCSTNERDGLGDDLVPDYLTRVKSGAFYGWPWWYLGDHEDPRHAGERPDLKGKVTVPDVPVQAHSASLEMTFYDGTLFPGEYRGDAFAAFHGSWNRAKRTGYKVVRVRMKDGQPTGEYDDFLTGFVIDDVHVWGRPVGVTVAHDGALLVTEDGNGTLWRVAPER